MSAPTPERKCIGCACHRVPWNQGSDYCDVCITQSYHQCNHRQAAKIFRATGVYNASKGAHRIYHCGICDHYHPWSFAGDCRDDRNRYADPEHYAERKRVSIHRVQVFDMDERVKADMRGER